MYIDLIIIIVLLLLVLFVFRRFSSFVYSMAIIDIFLRLLNYICTHLPFEAVKTYVENYFPKDIGAIIGKYTSGIFCDVLMWGYVIVYLIFLGYITAYFVNKKK